MPNIFLNRYFYISLIVVLVLGLGGWYLAGESLPGTSATTTAATTTAAEVVATKSPAASSTPRVAEYSEKALDEAQEAGKLILLYFHANWCPACYTELLRLESVASELDAEQVAIFAVNYKDSKVIADEEELARNLEISQLQTKVIIYQGKEVLRSTEGWDKSRYLVEVARVLSGS